jgi:hypothetical protein
LSKLKKCDPPDDFVPAYFDEMEDVAEELTDSIVQPEDEQPDQRRSTRHHQPPAWHRDYIVYGGRRREK